MMTRPLDVAAGLAEATRDLDGPQDLDVTLRTILQVARDSMIEIDEVGITVSHRDGRVETRAATGDRVRQLDELQYKFGEGPCLHAMHTGETVVVPHLAHDQRWPLFVPPAARLGLRAQLGVRLHVSQRTIGALNVYSFSADEISRDSEQLAELFAAHAGLALGHAQRLEHLSTALASRRVIGMALGVLMERLDIDEDRAFAYLTRMSSTSQTKLRDIATSIVDDVNARRTDVHRVEPVASRDPGTTAS